LITYTELKNQIRKIKSATPTPMLPKFARISITASSVLPVKTPIAAI
jgi:hypothetical protein